MDELTTEKLFEYRTDDRAEMIFLDSEELVELQAFGSSGGKSRVVNKLLKCVPEHNTYLECYAGGAALYWKKEKTKTEVLNDKNPEIAQAYEFIKNATEEQISKLQQMNWNPYKELFFKLKDSEVPKDPIQRFYRFYYVLAYSYGLNSKNYGYKTKRVAIFKRIPKLQSRMTDTIIYSDDAVNILNKYNKEDTFAYLDPPYPDEWAGPEGTKLFTKEDTQKLHDCLKQFKGKFLISINDLPWIREMFKDFKISNLMVPRTFKKGDEPKIELLISNYDLKATKEELENITKPEVLSETGSSNVEGSIVPATGLLPIDYKKKKEKEELEENSELLSVVEKDGEWCVVHGHPMVPGSKTDKPIGSIIKCFPTKEQADAMHKAIIISEIKSGKIKNSDGTEEETKENIIDFEGKYSCKLIRNDKDLIISFTKLKE